MQSMACELPEQRYSNSFLTYLYNGNLLVELFHVLVARLGRRVPRRCTGFQIHIFKLTAIGPTIALRNGQ